MKWSDISKYRSHIYGFTIVWIIFLHSFYFLDNSIHTDYISVAIFRHGNIGVDIFLFLSGVSMYFSMQKLKGKQGLATYYKNRLAKILPVYLLLCIVFLLIEMHVKQRGFAWFLENATGTAYRISSYWYIFCILICYFIYPVFYKLIQDNKEYVIRWILLLYLFALVVLTKISPEFFAGSEILTTRIPIFILGSLTGKKVYEEKPISPNQLSLLILGAFCLLPLRYLLTLIGISPLMGTIFSRVYGGIVGIGVVVIVAALLPYILDTAVARFFKWCGKYTLEIYIIHMFVLYMSASKLKTYAIFHTYKGICGFAICLLAFCCVAAVVASKVIGWITGLPKQLRASQRKED